MDKKLRLILASILIACGFAGFGAYTLLTSVIHNKAGLVFYLRPGMSKKTFVAHLSDQGVIRYPLFFYIYTHSRKDGSLKAGEYLFMPGSNLVSIWKQVTNGTGLVYHPFTTHLVAL